MRYLLFLLCFSLYAAKVDIFSDFLMDDIPIEWSHIQQKGVELAYGKLETYEQADPQDVQKILVMNPCLKSSQLLALPKSKLVLFVWEPLQLDPTYYQPFSRVYTWDDTLIDNVKFFKLYYPYLTAFPSSLPSFEERKFCTLIASHWTPERTAMIRFFNMKPYSGFEFYGKERIGKMPVSPFYKGPISGYHSGSDKIETLKKYRFCICFENIPHLKGYVTEKILNCFSAGCVPIYLGAANIEQYIPKDCFIDYRQFSTNEELYLFLKRMTKARYAQYLSAIQSFLKSKEAELFTPAFFESLLLKALE